LTAGADISTVSKHPAVLVDSEIVITGRVPTVAELKNLLASRRR
jgi:hypothetical protein